MRDERARFICITATALAAATALLGLPATSGGAGGAAESALARFLEPAARPLVSYRALRHLHGTTDDGDLRATMTVWTELVGDGQFRYHIVSEEGSDHTRKRVFRGVLEAERKAVGSGECDLGDLTVSNYAFTPDGGLDRGLARIGLTPRRPHRMRVVGALFVRPDDGQLVRVEGRLSERPSFWTRRIDVVRQYGRLAGTRVPTSVEATAHVLVVGRYEFSMEWDYESVNGVRVGSPEVRVAQADW